MIATLSIPSPGASASVLRAHFFIAGAQIARLNFEDASQACQVCMKDGENRFGKEGNPGGRNRYCSEECQAVQVAYDATIKKEPVNVETPSAGASPSRARRARRKGAGSVPAADGGDAQGGGGSEGDVRGDEDAG